MADTYDSSKIMPQPIGLVITKDTKLNFCPVNWQVGSCFFGIGTHSETKGQAKDPSRIMFNLETPDIKGEFERIKAHGAHVVKEPCNMGGAWIATFADPDGNYFQLISPWEGQDK